MGFGMISQDLWLIIGVILALVFVIILVLWVSTTFIRKPVTTIIIEPINNPLTADDNSTTLDSDVEILDLDKPIEPLPPVVNFTDASHFLDELDINTNSDISGEYIDPTELFGRPLPLPPSTPASSDDEQDTSEPKQPIETIQPTTTDDESRPQDDEFAQPPPPPPPQPESIVDSVEPTRKSKKSSLAAFSKRLKKNINKTPKTSGSSSINLDHV